MGKFIACVRGMSAALVAAVVSVAGFMLVGLFLPVWAMMLIDGRRVVQDAPAHGGIILLVTLPIVAILALVSAVLLTPVVYRWLSLR